MYVTDFLLPAPQSIFAEIKFFVKKVFFVFCLFTSVVARAQVGIPDLDILNEFKSTQTAILIDNTRKVKSNVDMKTIISESWDVTPVIIDKESALAKYKKPGYSVLRVENIESGGGAATGRTIHYQFLRLVLFKQGKNGKLKEELVGHMYIGNNIKMTDGLFKAYLKMFNTALKKGETLPLTIKNIVSPKISELKNKTLYIPGYAFNVLGENSESKAKRKDSGKFLKKYDFKAQIEEQKQIDQRILKNEDIYFVLYFYYGIGVSCVSVVNANTGEIIYCHAGRLGKADPTFKPSDLGRISSAVKSGKVEEEDEKAGDEKDDE